MDAIQFEIIITLLTFIYFFTLGYDSIKGMKKYNEIIKNYKHKKKEEM